MDHKLYSQARRLREIDGDLGRVFTMRVERDEDLQRVVATIDDQVQALIGVTAVILGLRDKGRAERLFLDSFIKRFGSVQRAIAALGNGLVIAVGGKPAPKATDAEQAPLPFDATKVAAE